MYTRRFWVDTETTGLDPKRHFAFQISYLIEENGKVLLDRTLEMHPDDHRTFEFTKEAERVHGYSRGEILSLAPESEQFGILLEDLRRFAGNRLTLTGYNIPFDIDFLQAIFTRCKPERTGPNSFYKYFDYMYCDVMQLVQAHRIAGKLNLPSIELDKVCEYLGISTQGAHNSMTDIRNTKAVFDILVSR
jgi:DNA polymerase III epsilon subunit-like protein